MTEEEARQLDICPGCGTRKPLGTVVCWRCFKYREDVTPFKYFKGTLNEWLKESKARPLVF